MTSKNISLEPVHQTFIKTGTTGIFKGGCRSCIMIPVILVALAVLLFPLRGIYPSPDSFGYSNRAHQMYENPTSENVIIWRPIFPLLISVSYRILGESLQSGFYVVRLFFVLNIMLCYFIGTKLFSRIAGLTFSLLVITSYHINNCSSLLLLDNVFPFFVLAQILFTYLAFEKSRFAYFIFAGIALSLAWLVKPSMAILYIPLPFLMLLFRKYRTIKNSCGLILTCISFVVVLSPWIYQVSFGSKPLNVLLGPLTEIAAIKDITLASSANETSIFQMLRTQLGYFNNTLYLNIARRFILWPLFVLSLIHTIYLTAFKRNRASAVVLFSTLLFLPAIFMAAKICGRTSLLMILYFLLYAMAANLLAQLPLKRSPTSSTQGRVHKISNILKRRPFLSVLLLCLILQIFVGRSRAWNFLSLITMTERPKSFSFWTTKTEVVGWLAGKAVADASDWMLQNVPPGSRILCEQNYNGPTRFYTRNSFRICTWTFFNLWPKVLDSPEVQECGHPVFIWPRIKTNKRMLVNCLTVMCQGHFLGQVDTYQPAYIMIGLRRNYLTLYLEANPSFTLEKSFSNGEVKIYKVNYPVKPMDDFPTKFEISTFKYLSFLHRNMRSRYEQEKQIFQQCTGWSGLQVQEFFTFIENNDMEAFWKNYQQFQRQQIYP